MIEKLKSRLPGGLYFRSLIQIINYFLVGKLNLELDLPIIKAFFLGEKIARKDFFLGYQKYYKILEDSYGISDYFDFYGIRVPKVEAKDTVNFVYEFLDIIYPVIFNRCHIDGWGEGPYIYGPIDIKKGDVIIDAGANIGLFSAVASYLGGIVYSFEPVNEIIKNYLEKTAKLNKNINIVPFALSNKSGRTEINISLDKIGQSSLILKPKNFQKRIITTITLDDWIKKNNIQRVDFIKADIEGAERLMIEGAIWVLNTYAPKLSICIYHLKDDKDVLKRLIKKANPSYNIEYRWGKLYAWVEE
jgi:FkbM family methyltransferase